MATRTVGELSSTIKQLIKMDLAELGDSAASQDTYIYEFLSLAMHKLARLAYNVKISDIMNIIADGYVTFKVGGNNITDLFEPIRILDTNGKELQKRHSFSSSFGWWRESANSQIHVKGLNGDYTLHYIKYPDWIIDSAQVPEWPSMGYLALIYETMGMIKESKNYYQESEAMYAIAKRHLKTIVMANEYSRGTMGGIPPTVADVDKFF